MDRFSALGVIKNAPCQTLETINAMFAGLKDAFSKQNINKQAIVELVQTYIPNFEHIETGRGLDMKM